MRSLDDVGVNRIALGLAASAILLAATNTFGQSSVARSRSAADATGAAAEEEALVSVAKIHVASRVFHATRDIFVWLPSGEAVTASRYPVLVFPDAEEAGQFRAALANVQFLINRQLIPPMIVVGVPYFANRGHELTPVATGSTAQQFPAAGGADDNIRFIADELLPWIDARYPTVPTRFIAGHSLGGIFVLHAMATRPELFRVVIAMSAPMWWNDGAASPQIAARIAGDTLHDRTLFLTSGGVGGLEAGIDSSTSVFTAQLTAQLDRLHNHRLRFERRRYAADPHEMTPLPSLVDGLRMAFESMLVPVDSIADAFSSGPPHDSAEVESIARRLQSRYAAAAHALGVPGRFPEAALNFLGSYALETKHPRLAATLLRENRDLYPQSSNAHESLGEALAALADTSGAVSELRAAIAIAKDTLDKTKSIISRTRERRVTAAAVQQIKALGRVGEPR